MIGWTLGLLAVFFPLFGHDGVLPQGPDVGPATWGPLSLSSSNAAVVLALVITITASVCLALGYRTRLAALLVFLGLLAFERRDPYAFDSGDTLLRIIAAYLALSGAGTSLSVDRFRRARDRFWEFPARSRWPLRLLQVQLSLIYLATVWAKTRGTTWNDGTAVSYALRIRDLERFPVPNGITTSVVVSNLMTYGTLALEVAIAILIWHRRARPWALGAGVALHLTIAYSVRVGFFTLAMLVLYVAFLPNETAARLIESVRNVVPRVMTNACTWTRRRLMVGS